VGRRFPAPPQKEAVKEKMRIKYRVRKANTTIRYPVTQRFDLDDCREGDKVLIVRKYGGLGDMLIISMIFPELINKYVNLKFAFACPNAYHEIFRDCEGLELKDYGLVEQYRYDYNYMVDISVPCHIWENIFVRYKHGLKWRNRLNIWAEWIGYRPERPVSCLRLRPDEVEGAKTKYLEENRKKKIAFAPLSHLWCKDIKFHREIYRDLKGMGYDIYYVDYRSLPGRRIKAATYREMGAALSQMDIILSVDTSVFHWGGILNVPTLGLFTMNDGEIYSKYYTSATTVQCCNYPCIAHGACTCSRRLAYRNCYGDKEKIKEIIYQHVNEALGPDNPGISRSAIVNFDRDKICQTDMGR
jgi:hypothetical protein